MSRQPVPTDQRTRAAAAGAARTATSAEAAQNAWVLQIAQQARTPLIIERREPPFSTGALTRHLVTLAFWSAWVHFLMPLVTLLVWMSGWRRLSTELLAPDGLRALELHLPNYLSVAGMLCGSLVAWALFNWWRFDKNERRRFSAPVSTEMQALSLQVPAADLHRWQAARRLVVRHDIHGHPCGISDAAALE